MAEKEMSKDAIILNRSFRKEFCKCKNSSSITTLQTMWGYWYVCVDCEHPLEDEFHYYTEDEH